MFEAILGSGMLINGLLNAVTSSVNAAKGRTSSMEIQKLNMDFQRALQDKQWERSSRLQRELREASAKDAAQSQAQMYANQQALMQQQAFLASWPLALPPDAMMSQLKHSDQSAIPTLNIMVVDPVVQGQKAGLMPTIMQNAVDDVVRMMCAHYSEQGAERPVRIFTRVQKAGVPMGTTQIQAVYSVFRSVPTIVLQAVQTINSCFRLDCAYWGIGSASMPMFTEIFHCDLDKCSDALLENIASEYETIRQKGLFNSDKHNQLLTLLREKKEKEAQCSAGNFSDAQCKMLTADICGQIRTLATKSFMPELNEEVQKLISYAYKLNMAMLADSHFLLEYHIPPLFPKLCSSEIAELPCLMEHADRFFSQSIEACSSGLNSTRGPLLEAEMAHAYQSAGNEKLALTHYTQGVQQLQRIVGPGFHKHAAWMGNNDLYLGAERLDILAPLNAEANIPSLCRDMLHMSPTQLNQRGAEAYKANDQETAAVIWLRAAKQGNGAAANNVAQMYEYGVGVPCDKEMAVRFYTQAIEADIRQAFCHARFTAEALLTKGDWEKAFLHYTRYLQSNDEEYSVEVQIKSALLMLTELHNKTADTLRAQWRSQISSLVPEVGGYSSAKSVAAALLQHYADRKFPIAIDALAVAYLKFRNNSITLFQGIQDAAPLDWQIDATCMDFLKSYVKLSKHNGTPRCHEFSQLNP